MPIYFSFDTTYLVMVLPVVLFAMWAQFNVKSTFEKYSGTYIQSGQTASEVARKILDMNGLYGTRIERIEGELTDHYDPEENVIRLSNAVYDSSSSASIGVAAHEAGHAIQHAEQYVPIKVREAIIPGAQIGSMLSIPLLVLGFILASFNKSFIILAYIGLILYASIAVFQIVTLPTEFDASKRAIQTLEGMNIMTFEELKGSKKVLRAAALTYVAGLAVTLMQLLRFILMFARRDD